MTDLPPKQPAPAAPSNGRGLRIALAVSVAINLAILGLAAGAMLGGGPHERMVRDLDFGPFTEALSEGDRAALRRDFFRGSPDLMDMRRQMKGDLEAVLAALRADPFDAEALRDVMARQRSRMADRLDLGQTLIFDRVAAMDAAERAAFADRLERRLLRGAGRN
ncbi:MAG: periplasmic heavy metal sensor [Pseudomonadota bacterium]